MLDQAEQKRPPAFMLGVVQLTLLIAVIVTVTGLLLKWSTRIEFSNGFFWACIISVGIALGSSMALSGAVLFSAYRAPDRNATIMENVRADYKKARPTRRFAAQMLVVALFSFLLSMLVGW